MASIRQPVPVGLGGEPGAIDDGTTCRMGAPLLGPAGMGVVSLPAPSPLGPSAAQAAVPESEPGPAKATVDKYLEALGKHTVPPLVRERVLTAVGFFETQFSGKSFADIVGYLKAIDFARDVQVKPLAAVAPMNSELVQYVASRQGPGNFFTKSGYPPEALGIATGNRQFQRFRVSNGNVPVLVCAAAATSDTWTPGRTRTVTTPQPLRPPGAPPGRAGELVGGGGLQIVIPDPVASYVRPG